jgi:hypothetical protein
VTVEQTDVIDLLSIDPQGRIVLTIADHLSWDQDEHQHMWVLQEKLNRYLECIESGEINGLARERLDREIAPGAVFVISVVAQHSPTPHANAFLMKAAETVRGAGLEWTFRLFRGPDAIRDA